MNKDLKIKELVKIKSSISDLIRLGPNFDGGYVVNKTALNISDILYCYGVGHNYDFENDYSKMFEHKIVRMFDPTVDIKLIRNNMHFLMEGLYGFGMNNTSFEKHLILNGDENKNIFLKIDVEGSEYDFFEFLNFDFLKNVTGLVIEFHELYDYKTRCRFKNIIFNLLKNYDITHLHGNNHTALLEFDGGFLFPSTPEITFIRKDLNNFSQYISRSYPIEGLDYPNNIHAKDYVLNF
jgi:hypothetical protein